MMVVPVTKFMGKNGFNFFRLCLLNEGVEYNNMFTLYVELDNHKIRKGSSTHPWKTKEVSIAVRAALGAINLIQMFEGKFEFACEGFDPVPQIAVRKRRELVKQRLNNSRVQNHHGQLENNPVWDKLYADAKKK